MPTSEKQMVKLNQVKKAKAEELSKQAAAGSQKARRSSRSSRKSASEPPGISNYFYVLFFRADGTEESYAGRNMLAS